MSHLIWNEQAGRHEMDFGGHKVFARTRINEGVMSIDYVEAPPELRGQGAAGEFMASLMEEAQKQNLKVRPICGYAVSWLRRHEEYSAQIIS